MVRGTVKLLHHKGNNGDQEGCSSKVRIGKYSRVGPVSYGPWRNVSVRCVVQPYVKMASAFVITVSVHCVNLVSVHCVVQPYIKMTCALR